MKNALPHIAVVSLLLGLFGCVSAPSSECLPPAQAAQSDLLPEGIDPAQTSDDPTYGYTKENPVKLGSSAEFGGPARSLVYLRHLRDSQFAPLAFRRDGNVGSGEDGHIVDRYTLTDSRGNRFEVFIDMYHPESTPLRCKAPKGLYLWK